MYVIQDLINLGICLHQRATNACDGRRQWLLQRELGLAECEREGETQQVPAESAW